MKWDYLKSKQFKLLIIWAVCVFFFLKAVFTVGDWRTASRASAGLAPDPQQDKEAVVAVYAARTYNWPGYFAVHSWIATKEKNADYYTTYQVIGFYLRRRGSALIIQRDIPDRYWYGEKPELIEELRGEKAERAIVQIKKLAAEYPYKQRYVPWPGPNSNTFVAHIIRNVDELTVELPTLAIGKDWLDDGAFFGRAPSGRGWQFSLFGLLGVTLGINEGIEINILGLNFGIDIRHPALKLPMIGRLGFDNKPENGTTD